jgi:2-polyprenyl-3-methyl-5-hydroxy-6-metoxy-1,4-benzoquinol methylase
MAALSSNARKHLTKNPVKRWLIDRFKRTVAAVVSEFICESILDVGCGEGFVTEAVVAAEPDARVTGVDLDADAVGAAKRRCPGAAFEVGDVLALPFADASFDLVLCCEVLEHVEDPSRALRELCRVSAGFVLVSVPHEPWFRIANFAGLDHLAAFGNAPGHINHWGARKFRRFVSEHLTETDMRLSFPWTIVVGRSRTP